MSRKGARAVKIELDEGTGQNDDFWPELCKRIAQGEVIPIVSDDAFIGPIFDIDHDGYLGVSSPTETTSESVPTTAADDLDEGTVKEQLTRNWAEKEGYPFADKENLARVALFVRAHSRDNIEAKRTQSSYWKEALLFVAGSDDEVPELTIADIKAEINEYSFSDIVAELGYPRRPFNEMSLAEKLATLPLPIYITTSSYDFLEQALVAQHRHPRTQVCFWAGEPSSYVDPLHKTDYEFEPSVDTPLVFHLFGFEQYPESLVVDEDDYVDYLTNLARDVNQERPILPLYLRAALAKSTLMTLGFHPHDWEFRTVYRGLLKAVTDSLRKFNLAIQMEPTALTSKNEVKEFLKRYFEPAHFTIHWSSVAKFVDELVRRCS